MDPLEKENPQVKKLRSQPLKIPKLEQSEIQHTRSSLLDPPCQSVLNPVATDIVEDEVMPLTGKPYFHMVLAKSHVKPIFNMVIPAKLYPVLPSAAVPVVLTYCGKSWETLYHGNRSSRRLDISWKQFAIDNNLRVGDACIFELVECSKSELKFRAQVLRGDFPTELREKVNGETSNTPIVID